MLFTFSVHNLHCYAKSIHIARIYATEATFQCKTDWCHNFVSHAQLHIIVLWLWLRKQWQKCKSFQLTLSSSMRAIEPLHQINLFVENHWHFKGWECIPMTTSNGCWSTATTKINIHHHSMTWKWSFVSVNWMSNIPINIINLNVQFRKISFTNSVNFAFMNASAFHRNFYIKWNCLKFHFYQFNYIILTDSINERPYFN